MWLKFLAVKILSLIGALALTGGLAWAQIDARPGEKRHGEPPVSREQAEQIARRHRPGQIKEITLETRDDLRVWEVHVDALDDEGDYEIIINSNSGRILEVSN